MKKNLFSLLFIAATLVFIVMIAFSNSELANAWGALFTLDLKWVFCALLGWFAYSFFDMLSLYYFLYKQRYGISMASASYITLIGFYYSNITPGASGGQPMQVYYLSKRDVPVAIGTSAISIKFFAQQMMIVLLATTFWVCNAGFVDTQLGGFRWAIYIGYAINFAAIPLILLVALHRPLVQVVINFFIRMGAKLKLVKHPQDSMVHISAGLDVYHASILRLAKHPAQIVWMLILAGLSLLGLMSVPFSVYHAFRLTGKPWYQLFTLAFLLFISASYTPLPGASGAQEGGFLAFFHGFFTQGTIGLALLVWRFFTYYLFLLVGAVMSIAHTLRANHGHPKGERAGGDAVNAANTEEGMPAVDDDNAEAMAMVNSASAMPQTPPMTHTSAKPARKRGKRSARRG